MMRTGHCLLDKCVMTPHSQCLLCVLEGRFDGGIDSLMQRTYAWQFKHPVDVRILHASWPATTLLIEMRRA